MFFYSCVSFLLIRRYFLQVIFLLLVFCANRRQTSSEDTLSNIIRQNNFRTFSFGFDEINVFLMLDLALVWLDQVIGYKIPGGIIACKDKAPQC